MVYIWGYTERKEGSEGERETVGLGACVGHGGDGSGVEVVGDGGVEIVGDGGAGGVVLRLATYST
jgi:hypothetical protein